MPIADRLASIDTALLDRVFQPITDRLGDRPSAFDLGLSLELGAVVLELAGDAGLFMAGGLGWGTAIWDGFSCACGLWFYVFMGRQRGLVRAGSANPLRIIYRPLRLLAIVFALWSLYGAVTAGPPGWMAHLFDTCSNFVFVIGMYFISCQPRPPGWRRTAAQITPAVAPVWN